MLSFCLYFYFSRFVQRIEVLLCLIWNNKSYMFSWLLRHIVHIQRSEIRYIKELCVTSFPIYVPIYICVSPEHLKQMNFFFSFEWTKMSQWMEIETFLFYVQRLRINRKQALILQLLHVSPPILFCSLHKNSFN